MLAYYNEMVYNLVKILLYGDDESCGLEFLKRAGGWCEPVKGRAFPLSEPLAMSQRPVAFILPSRGSTFRSAIWVATRIPSSHVLWAEGFFIS
jgi:hypothetical protein